MSKKLIPCILDELSTLNPDKLYAEVPVSPRGYELGTRNITYKNLANAVNGLARWLTSTLGPGQNFQTISYIGPNDLGHNIALIAAVKAGYRLLLTSPRYGTVGQVKLMKQVNCNDLLVSAETESKIPGALSAEHQNLRKWTLPSLNELFDTDHRRFEYTKSYEEAKKDPLVVVHTSGTSGFPKPIVWTHEWAVSFAQQRFLNPQAGFESLDLMMAGTRMLSLMPPFHAGHLFVSLLYTFYCESTCIYPPAEMPPSAKTAVQVATNSRVDTIWLTPAHVDELGDDDEMINLLAESNVETVFWAGGSILPSSGEAIAKRLNIFTTCGSTETGMWPSIRPAGKWNPDIWRAMCFNPEAGILFRHQTDGLYGAVMTRKSNPEETQPVFRVFDTLDEFDTKDLFQRVPGATLSECWEYHGRSDDLQVFQTGFKWHPVFSERRLTAENRQSIQEALLIVTGYPEVIALFEPTADVRSHFEHIQKSIGEEALKAAQGKILDKIWPTVDALNRSNPVYAQIDRKRCLFTSFDLPMTKTAKGNVQRRQTVENYSEQIKRVVSSTHIIQNAY